MKTYLQQHLTQLCLAGLLLCISLTTPAFNTSTCLLNDHHIAKVLLKLSKVTHEGSKTCLCPYDTSPAGGRCGQFSQWTKSGGKDPKCFLNDISQQDINTFKVTTCTQFDVCCQGHGGPCGCIGSEHHSEIYCCDGTLSSICTDCLSPDTPAQQNRNSD